MKACLRCGNFTLEGAQTCDRCGYPISQPGMRTGTKIAIGGCLGIMLLITVFSVLLMRGASVTSTRVEYITGTTRGVHAPPPVAVGPVHSTKVTRANYERLKEGMSFDEVKAILGSVDKIEFEARDGTGSTAAYNWGNDDIGIINCAFHNERLYSKMEISLKY